MWEEILTFISVHGGAPFLPDCYSLFSWIKEAIAIRKKGGTTMNRDEGQYFLSHVFDEILMKKKHPIGRSTCNTESGNTVARRQSTWSTPGGYSTLSWVWMCGPKFRPPPYNKTRGDANLLPISKPFVSWRALFKTNQCFLQCKLGCISTFWQPIDKPKDKFVGNYAFCKNASYI